MKLPCKVNTSHRLTEVSCDHQGQNRITTPSTTVSSKPLPSPGSRNVLCLGREHSLGNHAVQKPTRNCWCVRAWKWTRYLLALLVYKSWVQFLPLSKRIQSQTTCFFLGQHPKHKVRGIIFSVIVAFHYLQEIHKM